MQQCNVDYNPERFFSVIFTKKLFCQIIKKFPNPSNCSYFSQNKINNKKKNQQTTENTLNLLFTKQIIQSEQMCEIHDRLHTMSVCVAFLSRITLEMSSCGTLMRSFNIFWVSWETIKWSQSLITVAVKNWRALNCVVELGTWARQCARICAV